MNTSKITNLSNQEANSIQSYDSIIFTNLKVGVMIDGHAKTELTVIAPNQEEITIIKTLNNSELYDAYVHGNEDENGTYFGQNETLLMVDAAFDEDKYYEILDSE